MKRVIIQLSYTADFDDDFDTHMLHDVDRLIGFGLVSLLRKEPEQGVDIVGGSVRLNLRFPGARARGKRTAPKGAPT